MDSFVVSVIMLSTFISIGHCFPMVVVIVDDNITAYAIVELAIIDKDSWQFVIKSTQIVQGNKRGKVSTDCTAFVNSKGKKCGIRFSDESIYKAKKLAPVKEEIIIEGEIEYVEITNNTTLKSNLIYIKMSNKIFINQYKSLEHGTIPEGFNGLKVEKNGLVLLVIQASQRETVVELFKSNISALVEMGQGENFEDKRDIMIQPNADSPKIFGETMFLFVKYREVQQVNGTTNYVLDQNEVLFGSTCDIYFFLPTNSNNASGMFNLSYSSLKIAGIIWIEWNQAFNTKDQVNTLAKFEKLKKLNGCSFSSKIFTEKKSIGVRINAATFDPFTNKFMLDFDFGNKTFLYFEYEGIQCVEAHQNTEVKLFTIFGNSLDKFEEALSQANSKNINFKVTPSNVILETAGMQLKALKIIVLNPIITKLIAVKVFEIPLWQYRYKD